MLFPVSIWISPISYRQDQFTYISHVSKHAEEDQQLVWIVFQRRQPINVTGYVTDWVVTVHHWTHLLWRPIRNWHVVGCIRHPGSLSQSEDAHVQKRRNRPRWDQWRRRTGVKPCRCVTISAEIKGPTITWRWLLEKKYFINDHPWVNNINNINY